MWPPDVIFISNHVDGEDDKVHGDDDDDDDYDDGDDDDDDDDDGDDDDDDDMRDAYPVATPLISSSSALTLSLNVLFVWQNGSLGHVMEDHPTS